MNSKCEMAKHRYCNKSFLGYCSADEKDIKKCPYLKAIEEIVKLSILKNNYEDDLK